MQAVSMCKALRYTGADNALSTRITRELSMAIGIEFFGGT